MLYPIELLGQVTCTTPNGAATDGVHVNGQGEFCHVVRQLFRRKPLFRTATDLPLLAGPRPASCKMH